MNIHPVADLFPLMTAEEFDALKADIAANGLREPIWTYQDSIIDGRNRHRACTELGIDPVFREWGGEGSLVLFVMSLNLHRRHLSTGQRGAVAAEIEPMLAAEAKERQREAQSRGGKASGKTRRGETKIGVNSPQSSEEPTERAPKATEQAAKIVGVGGSSVRAAKALKKNAPELFEAVKAGKMTLNRAVAKMKKASEPPPEEKVYRVQDDINRFTDLFEKLRPNWVREEDKVSIRYILSSLSRSI